jgi:hypothetical protein
LRHHQRVDVYTIVLRCFRRAVVIRVIAAGDGRQLQDAHCCRQSTIGVHRAAWTSMRGAKPGPEVFFGVKGFSR